MEKTQLSEPPREDIERGYEVGDVSLKVAVYATVGFIIFGIVTHLFLTTVWHIAYRQAAKSDEPRSAITDERPPAFAPPLQPSIWHNTTPYQDMKAMDAAEDQVFKSIGWTPETNHMPRVPDDILKKVATRPGMPTTAPAGGAK